MNGKMIRKGPSVLYFIKLHILDLHQDKNVNKIITEV